MFTLLFSCTQRATFLGYFQTLGTNKADSDSDHLTHLYRCVQMFTHTLRMTCGYLIVCLFGDISEFLHI